MVKKEYIIYVEVYRYLVCDTLDDTKDYLSTKICCYTIQTWKNLIKNVKYLIGYGDFILNLMTGIIPLQAIGLGIPP